MIRKSIINGGLGAVVLLGFYFAIVGALSEWSLAKTQFFANWHWIVGLAVGFGIQISLFSYLRALHRDCMSGTVATTTGTFSGLTMVACCTHYLVSILPIIGISGLAASIESYQQELFALGAAVNVGGIIYMLRQLSKAKQETSS